MKTIRKYLLFAVVLASLAFQKKRQQYHLYTMNDFSVEAANVFVRSVDHLPAVDAISIFDERVSGVDFKVNRQKIFIDTNRKNQPNYYSYKKRAAELDVPPDSLLNCITLFYKIGVNEFLRDSGSYRFPVEAWLGQPTRGYVYFSNLRPKTKDTVYIKSKHYAPRIVLTRQVGQNWFEYHNL